jgi:hypothetical protein
MLRMNYAKKALLAAFLNRERTRRWRRNVIAASKLIR